MSRGRTPGGLQLWIDARKRHRLSHEQVQMARELGLNPRKLGKLDNHRQEPWKLPRPVFEGEHHIGMVLAEPLAVSCSMNTGRDRTNTRNRAGVINDN